MKKIIYSLLILIVCPHYTNADIPKVKILGGDVELDAGELVILSSEIENKPDNLQSVIYKWKILDGVNEKQFIAWPEGSKVIFSAGISSKTYVAILTASFLFVDRDEEGNISDVKHALSEIVTQKIKVKGLIQPTPPNPINPNPPWQPVPPAPAPTSLSDLSYNWIITSNMNLPPSEIKHSASILANCFETVAELIKNNLLTDPMPILDITGTDCRAALSRINVGNEFWKPWGDKFQEHIYGLYNQNKLVTAQQYAVAWRQIADGLRRYSNSQIIMSARWNKRVLSYKILDWLDEFSKIEQRAIVRQAWHDWEKVCDIQVYETGDSKKADIIIIAGPIDGRMGTLAWATLPSGYQLKVKFDTNENWVKNLTKTERGIIFHHVACHEFGHSLGLGHSRYSDALMSPGYSPYVAVPQQSDDISKIQRLYGPRKKIRLEREDFIIL